MVACRLLDLREADGEVIDVLIGLKFPAYLIPHDNKVLWIMHQHRQAYDLWDHSLGGDLLASEVGPLVREAVHAADRQVIPQAQAVFANSRNVSARLQRYCGISAEPLYHPPPSAEKLRKGPAESYLFFPSRLLAAKRQILVLQALALTTAPVRVKFAGVPNHSSYLQLLQKEAQKLGVGDRAEWLGAVTEEEKCDLYAHCRAVIYPPFDEDYGYVTLEAMLSAKPVITCSDSGGPLEFVKDGVTGLVCEPRPESLALMMDRVWSEIDSGIQWGEAGFRRYHDLGISWENTISRLLERVR
jgi:glycosyltransferase involved in cell wall biosynthesis